MEFTFPKAADLEKVRAVPGGSGIRRRGGAELRHGERRAGAPAAGGEAGRQPASARACSAAVQAHDPGVELRRTEVVGPQVGQELAEKGALAVLFTFVLILAYVAIRFQWKLGVGAIVAALHDPIIILGFFCGHAA